ncbi:two-component regulator propeller domain-containing protein [Lunatibacter salilacus]|uniref:two-component regulator propeller domain-containing protein n=1 Tax=Lunatibacter salilacus TaxID=2483804 RepID=UPI00131DD449|nr:two-component regulator propeller domain-containing protein [Lunatibacter salilacus]
MKTFVLSCISIFLVLHVSGQNIKFKTFTAEDGLSNNSINQIMNDPSGGIWVGTWDGLNFYDGHSFKVYKHDPQDSSSLRGNFISEILLDNKRKVWVKSNSNSISQFVDGYGFINFLFDKPISKTGVTPDKQLLVELDGEKYLYKGERFVSCGACGFYEEIKPDFEKIITKHYPDLIIKDQYRDNKGNIWFATITTGLFILPYDTEQVKKESFHNYTVDGSDGYSLRSNEIYAIHEDLFGNIWLGLKDGGLSMAYKNSNNIFTISALTKKHAELPAETVRAVHQEQNGNIWLGYYNSGIYYSNPSNHKFEALAISPPTNPSDWKRIRSIFQDSQGSIWVGTYGGIVRIYPSKKIEYYQAEVIPHLLTSRNYDIMEDVEENALWIACWGGMSKYSLGQQQFIPFDGQEKLRHFKVRKIVKGNGGLWLATENDGVVQFEDGNITVLDNTKGLLDNSVYSIHLDEPTGNYWFSTLAGISIYHPEKGYVHQITEKDGLMSQLVYGLLQGDQHIWASTTKGIAAIDRNTYQVRVLPPEEGWQSVEFSEGSYFQNDRGTLFFGGVKGVNFFNPKSMELTYDLPKLNLKVKDQDQTFVSGYYKGDLDVSVSPVMFTTNPINKIIYRLDPLEKEWKSLSETNFIHYESLAPGEYTLYVKNQSDETGNEIASMPVVIPMPVWRSPYLQFLAVFGAFAGFLFIRHRSNRRHRHKLQTLIEERTRTVEEQKTALMLINADLDKKNKEILEQKANLLALHHQQKNPDFEIEKFKNFVLNQFQGPLAYVRSAIDAQSLQEVNEKKQILGQLDGLIKELKDWENLSLLDHLEDSKESMTILSKLFENLTFELGTQLKKRDIFLVCDYQLIDEWVEIDVLRTKLFFHCVFRELIKFIESNSELIIEAWISGNCTYIRTRTNSDILAQNFSQIMHSSPYIKSAEKILVDLGGTMEFETDPSVTLKISLPFKNANHPKPLLSWEAVEFGERIDPNRFNVVILGKPFETDSLVKMIDHELINLFVAEESALVLSVIQEMDIDALIIYNEKINQGLFDLMTTLHASHEHRVGLPIIYIYEFIAYGFQEKLMDLGIDTFIQLPSSSEFIRKKLLGQLQHRKKYLKEKRLHTLVGEEGEETVHLSPNEKLVRLAMRIIREQYANPNFRVEMLSQQLGISKIKCYRLFKDVLDTSPSDLIIKLRLQKAEQLLVRKKMNISEVGFECGFNDPKYFSKLFKKHYGASPRSFV